MSSLATENAKSSKSWPRVRLGEVCEFRRGLTYSKNDEVASSSIAVLRSNNVELETGKLNLGELKYLRDDFELPPEKFVVRGSILMCMANGSKAHLGKVAIIDIEDQFAFGGFMGLLIPDIERILSSYLYWVLTSYEFKQLIAGLTDGANINNLKFSDIALFEFPLPPLSVQHEIVARLEKELAAVERMAKGFEAMKTEADQLFKSTLKETFEEVSRGGTKTRRLGDVCEIQRGGSPRPIKNFITDDQNGLNWIKIGDVSPDGKYITNTADKIKQSGLSKTRQVFEGDFLLSNSMSFGRPYILRINGCIHDGWLVLRGFKKVFLEEYFYYLLRSDFVQDQFNKLAHGSTVRNLNTDAVAMVEVCEILFSTQRKIVAKLDAVRARCEKLKRAAEEGVQTAALMRKAILKEAFA